MNLMQNSWLLEKHDTFFLWNRYVKKCATEGKCYYQYRQYCELYNRWCEENYETAHFNAVIAQKMEVDFAGKTFSVTDPLTGEIRTVVVFVAILPYSQYIYAEGMLSTKEPQWIEVNNHALTYFGGVPALVVCDNCKQAVIVNKDWIEPELNKDYADWADHYGTVILPAKVRKPKFKSSVENAVGILEKGLFHKLEELQYFSLEEFNKALWTELDALNKQPFKKKEHNRDYYWQEEKLELMPLPSTQYEYMERRTAKVSSDFHIRFDNAYYSVDKAFLHKKVSINASSATVRIYSMSGEFLCEWPKAVRKGQWSTNVLYKKGSPGWEEYGKRDPYDSGVETVRSTDLSYVSWNPEFHKKIQQQSVGRMLQTGDCIKQAEIHLYQEYHSGHCGRPR